MQLTSDWAARAALKKMPADEAGEQFRQLFKKSLHQCLQRNFSMKEAFGMIFSETLRDVPLTPTDEAEAFNELLAWAKQCRLG